jgi:type IV secretion system protein TrbL
LSPGSIFAQGLKLAVHLLFTMSGLGILKNIVGAVVGIVAALAIAVAFTLIAIEMAITLVESYVVTGAGIFLLGFAAFRGTSGISERYLGYTVAVGIRLFVIHLLVGAGIQLAQGWGAYINDTTVFDMATPLSIAGSALLFALLTWRIPKLVAGLAAGVTSLGMQDVFGAAGGAVRLAAMAVPAGQIAAGTMTIAQAASRASGGGARGAIAGVRAAGGALSREVSAASVPRLQQAARRIRTQADTARRPAAGDTPTASSTTQEP